MKKNSLNIKLSEKSVTPSEQTVFWATEEENNMQSPQKTIEKKPGKNKVMKLQIE